MEREERSQFACFLFCPDYQTLFDLCLVKKPFLLLSMLLSHTPYAYLSSVLKKQREPTQRPKRVRPGPYVIDGLLVASRAYVCLTDAKVRGRQDRKSTDTSSKSGADCVDLHTGWFRGRQSSAAAAIIKRGIVYITRGMVPPSTHTRRATLRKKGFTPTPWRQGPSPPGSARPPRPPRHTLAGLWRSWRIARRKSWRGRAPGRPTAGPGT